MKYWVLAYMMDEVIIFFRTTSSKLLIKKVDELKKANVLYNTLTMNGWDISFK